MPNSTPPAIVLIICGPAGSGKTTLCERLLQEFPDSIQRLITTTSRQPRKGETDGIDYHFLPVPVFVKRIQEGKFIEWAKVHGRYYGSQTAHVLKGLSSGKDLLLNIDIQGAAAFRRRQLDYPLLKGRIHTLFIKPASLDQLYSRLVDRGTDDQDEIKLRLNTAREEILVADEFDTVIVSDSKEADYAALLRHYKLLKKGSPL